MTTANNTEIERKFLVNPLFLPPEGRAGGNTLVQGYLTPSPCTRIRISNPSKIADGTKAWLTIKGPGLVTRQEFEYQIPVPDAFELLKMCQADLSKIRRLVKVTDRVWDNTKKCVRNREHTWEVDEFLGEHKGLWLAELELGSEGEEFFKPDWLGQEVSRDPRYTNQNLAYWGKPA